MTKHQAPHQGADLILDYYNQLFGLSQSLSNIVLYGNMKLLLPLKSLEEEFKDHTDPRGIDVPGLKRPKGGPGGSDGEGQEEVER